MWTVRNVCLVGSVLMHIDVHAGVSAAPLAARQRSCFKQAKAETAARVHTRICIFLFFEIREGAAYVQEHHIKLLTHLQVPRAFIRIIKRLPGSLGSFRRSA